MIIHGDCLEEMRKLPSESFRAVVTSPPYNLRSTSKPSKNSNWKNPKLINEGYDGYTDNLSHDDYVKWQRECLSEMMRLITDDGAIFYNHHWRTQNLLLQQRNDILDGFPLRQIIIWDRGLGGINFNPAYYLPNYEVIYLIAKPKFKIANGINKFGAVWSFRMAKDNPHPAPFPEELVTRVVLSVGEGPILDPFLGSGTTGVVAKRYGMEWVGIEQSEEYVKMAKNRTGMSSSPPLLF